MKRILFAIIGFLCPLIAESQLQIAEIDTSYTSLRYGYNQITEDSVFFETTTVIYKNGRQAIEETILGDTAGAINYYVGRATLQARQFAVKANEVWSESKAVVVDFLLLSNSTLQSTFDTTIMQASIDQFGAAIDSTNWDVFIDGDSTDVGLLTINPSGNSLKLEFSGSSYTCFPIGDEWIRVNGYPSGGQSVDIHRKRNTGVLEFRNINESFVIKRQ